MITLIQITDTHICESPVAFGNDTHTRFHAMVNDIHEIFSDAAFVVHTGDIGGFHGDAVGYENYRRIASRLEIPVHYVLGNHDDRTNFRETIVQEERSEKPWHWAFDHSGWSFIGIDSSDGGLLPRSELAWLERTLDASTERPAFVFLHHTPLPIGNGLDRPFMLRESIKLLSLLQAHRNVRGVAFGHMHLTRTLYFDGTYYFCTPSLAAGFTLVPSDSVYVDTDTCYRVFQLHDDESIETWIRHPGGTTAEEAREHIKPTER